MHYQISESDIRAFMQVAPQPWKRFLNVFVVLILLTVVAWGAQSLVIPRETATALSPDSPIATPFPTKTPTSTPTGAPGIIAPTPVPATPTPLPVTIPKNTFFSSDLGISAPITWQIATDQQTMNTGLSKGLINLAGTAVPGQKGVVSLAGHSSNIIWAHGNYNGVFSPLEKAKVGQIYEVNYNDVMYRYEVVRTFEVQPDDVSVLSSDTFTGLHLITCTPLGTSLRRLIVEAKQVFPDPSLNTDFSAGTISGQLPSGQ